ncbi:hypothetical protein AVEN_201842-1 [Araneus ventricosus]|uniref:CHMP7 winged helix domain-containing protein n=1 Tax=Araneus ventricosus TaxID=182803 RepID=A0A4Y2U1B3_ARAVE|nr:hypothetical protein AVEN_201842-1 [Araneus ventricosus]
MPLDNLLLQSASAIDPVCWKHSLSLILMKGLPDLVTNVISLQKEMLMTWRQGLIIRMSDYMKVEHEKGWASWGFDMLVQKPVSWAYSSVHSFLKLNKTEENYIILPVVQDLASKIVNLYKGLIETKWTDNAVFLEHLRQECKDICSDFNFKLAVIQLQREKKASIFEDNGEKVIKFRKEEEKKIEPLSEVDKAVLSLKRARDAILTDMETLEASILR